MLMGYRIGVEFTWRYLLIMFPLQVSVLTMCAWCHKKTCKYGMISNHTVGVTAAVNSLWNRDGILAFKKHLCTLKSVNFKNFMSEWNIHISVYGKIFCVEFQRVPFEILHPVCQSVHLSVHRWYYSQTVASLLSSGSHWYFHAIAKL